MHSVSEFLRFFTGTKFDVCSVHMYNYNARTIRMHRALWSYTELSLTLTLDPGYFIIINILLTISY